MSLLPLFNEGDVSPEVNGLFDRFRNGFGMQVMPPSINVQGYSPPLLNVYYELIEAVFQKGQVPPLTKQMAFLAIASAHNCEYCAAATMEACRMMGMEEEMIRCLTDDLDALNPKLTRIVVQFAVKCATDKLNVNEEDFELLRTNGISNEEIMELVGLAAYANYAITMADALKLIPEYET